MKRVYTLGILGLFFIGMAIFAEKLGLDNDIGWGRKRIFIAQIGAVMLLAALLLMAFRKQLDKLTSNLSKLKEKFSQLKPATRANIFTFITAVLIMGIFYWYVLPCFNNPKLTFDYYAKQAIAFRNGQLHLLDKPAPELLALSDPYNDNLRRISNVHDLYLIDASLYKEKYYLYWGPAPSLFLTVFNTDQIAKIKDKYVSFIFSCGLFLYLTLIIRNIWSKFNRTLPIWFLSFFLLTLGLSMPLTALMKNPRIYEAAVLGGQFFYIGGLYWVYTSLRDKGQNQTRLLLGGAHWAIALAIRLTTWPAIMFCAFATVLYILKDWKMLSFKKVLLSSSLIWIPLLLSVAGLGWYNWARFDSIFEFGLRYQLANADYSKFTAPFSIVFIKGNLYNYFLYPFIIQAKFPYFVPVENIFSNERMTGIIYTSVFLFFIFIPIFRILYTGNFRKDDPKKPPEVFLIFVLSTSLLIMLFVILSFYYPTVRYSLDFLTLFFVTTFFVMSNEYNLIENIRIRYIFLFTFTIMGVWSIVLCSLLSLPNQHIANILHLAKQIYRWLSFG